MNTKEKEETINESDFSGVYITQGHFDLDIGARIPKNTVVFIKDTNDGNVEVSTVSSESVKFNINKELVKPMVETDDNVSKAFDTCFQANKTAQEKHISRIKNYKVKENILMAILVFIEIISITQIISGGIVKSVTSLILVLISAFLLTTTITLRRKSQSLWFEKPIEYSKFMTQEISRENYGNMIKTLTEMGFNIYENSEG